ncbi:MAG: peptidylprolyl isomerase [Runella sp.]
MKVAPNQVVGIVYELSIKNENDDWQIVEVVSDAEPMYFIQGMSGLPDTFEDKINGLAVEDTFDFSLTPEEGYGDYDDEALAEIPLEVFQIDGQRQDDLLQIGNMVPMTNEDGHRLVGQIVDINDEYVLMDFNHPLAGRELQFKGKIVSLRPATADELDHGHVHGEGGVQH